MNKLNNEQKNVSMRKLSLDEMAEINGGDFITTSCAIIGAGSAIYTIGSLSNWWNPIGWVSMALAGADLACISYSLLN